MGIGKRIKEARNALNMTQEELAKLLGVTKGAVANYENETSHPKEPVMYKMFDALNVDANYLFQDVVNIPKRVNDVTLSEYERIKKYRDLDAFGRETVDIVLEREASRVRQINNAISNRPASLRIYTYMHNIACAGDGFYFDDIPTDTLEAPYMEGADFIIGVSGDSMEPTYSDGDLVYVQQCQVINIGDIGIFSCNNECLIKEAGEYGLISHNKRYPLIPGDETIRCIGLVLGKVTEGVPIVTSSASPAVLSMEDVEALRLGKELMGKKSVFKKKRG